MENKLYYRVCEGVTDYGHFEEFKPDTSSFIKNKNKDYYRSIYLYNEDQKKQAEEIIEIKKNGKLIKRPRGVAGIVEVTTPELVWDFDCKENISAAKSDTKVLIGRLQDMGMPLDHIGIYFSGNKGFAVHILTDKFFTPDKFKAITSTLAEGLSTYDSVVSNPSRLIRIPESVHIKSGLYKTRLNVDELDMDDDEIREIASEMYDTEPLTVVNVSSEIEAIEVEKKEVENITVFDRVNPNENPLGLSPWKLALLQGFFPPGNRNSALMILTSTLKSKGFDEDSAYSLLKSTIRKQSARYDQEPYSKEEFYNTIINQVYSPLWNGGNYSEDNFPKSLVEYFDKLGIKRADTKDLSSEHINDVYNVFEDYAQNIDANTIKLGIPGLDKIVRVTTSMLVGMLAAPAAGKCLGIDTPVMMSDGSVKKVQDVKVGDLIMGDDHTPRRVLTLARGRELLYNVQQDYGDDYVVNKSHILSVMSSKRKNPKITDINVEQYLTKSVDYRHRNRGFKVSVEFPTKKQKIDSYYVGLWLGDGCSKNTAISLNNKTDDNIMNYLKDLAKRRNLSFNLKQKDSENGSTYIISSALGQKQISVVTNTLLNDLRSDGLIDNKNKGIPDNYLKGDYNQRLQLLAGLIDSDGSYDKDRRSFDFISKWETLANDVVYLSRSLGFRSNVNPKIINGVTYYRVYISGDNLYKVPCLLDRKMPTNERSKKNPVLSKLTITPIGEGDYYGFTIDGNHRFLLGDFTVTHNTATILNVLNAMSLSGEESMFFSMDMGKPLIYQKMTQKLMGIEADELFDIFAGVKDKNGNIIKMPNEIKKQKIKNTLAENYENVKLVFDTGADPDKMRSIITNHEKNTGKKIRLVALDYLEKIPGPYSDATANSGWVAKKLQSIANDLQICVIVLLQPQKMVGDPRDPIRSYRKIKGASLIEQDCRVVIGLWREGYDSESFENDNYITYAVLKNTMGKLGEVDCYWDGLTGSVHELDDQGRDELKKLRKAKAQKKAAEDGF